MKAALVKDSALPALGTRARALFVALGLQSTPRYPKYQAAHLPGMRYLLDLIRVVYYLGYHGRTVRKRFGKSIATQLREIVTVMRRDGLDAQAYYMFELYRDGGMDLAGQYLTRYETKNGLYKAMNMLLTKKNGDRRTKLGDKWIFADLCAAEGIATVPVLVAFIDGSARWRITDLDAMDRDLFVKLRKGKGANGARSFRLISPGLYRAPDGREISRPALIDELTRQSVDAPVVVQPRLVNHPAIADLSTDSLMVVRIITCLDRNMMPVLTHGMLRVLGKIEQGWTTIAEFGVGVDLATGRLGPIAGDKIEHALEWLERHPITGAQVEGRMLPFWQEVKALALKAHGVCNDRAVIGWDIAITPDGPLVIEGNSMPDIVFPQRVLRNPAGLSPLGAPFSDFLDRLEAAHRKPQSAT